jgi:C4-dicarboxylate-specific signal transduction histidine kinase
MAELRQPLTAASNYIGVARMMLGTGGDPLAEAVVRKLDKASAQILRAGHILSQLRGQLCDDAAEPGDELP